VFDPLRIGRSLRAIRIRLGWRQVDVAEKAGVSRSFISKLERGQARATDLTRVEAVCETLGADLDVRVRWRGETLDRLLDEAHATIVDAFVRLLPPPAWATWLEVTFNDYGDRGSIDVLGWHAATRSLLVVEIKSVVPDAQGTLAPLDRKVRVAPKVARQLGLGPVVIGRLLVVADGPTSRRRIARFGDLFRAALPARNVEVRRWLAAPRGPISGVLFLSYDTAGGTRRTTAGRTRVRRPRGG
jgi:transcriptional regulator with XRE-family HTH domain